MDPATAARIQEWDDRPVSGGYRGLQELAEASFSGALTTGTAWLFLLNGRVVGVADGTLSSFEGVDATAYEAPDPSLPLLFAMQAKGGETRAKYYTDDNPLPETHETLSDAGFTGYIELSDNVLSGDYYVVYYGGKSMSAAFVGNTDQLLTGDEAFQQAADEVGIYEVMDIELDVRDVPEPTGADPAAAAVEADSEPPSDREPEPAEEPASTEPDAESSATETPEEVAEPESAAEPPAEPNEAETESTDVKPPADTEVDSREDPETGEPTPDATPESEPTPGEEAAPPESTPTPADDEDDPFSQEEAWREARTIPALDPEESDGPEPAENGGQQSPSPEPTEPDPSPEPAVEEDRIAELEAAIEAQSATIEELESRLESTSEEAEQLRAERESLQAELEAAREAEASAVASQEASPAAGEESAGAATPAGSLSAAEALDQTDLFVRYGSKGQPTLETAHDGQADRETVVQNLRLDHHTRFEEDEVTVEGQPFPAFLDESLEYRFVDWLVTDLLFEIQDTGSQRRLRDLYDAIPLVDRVEFQGEVTWRDQEGGETHSETFDVVCRNRMGQPLIVSNLNDVRDPATGEMMTGLIEGASTVAEGIETLGGAFMVTSSFFQPDALETTSEATGGGLLSRDKRWSYVKLSRRHGYHLCLVEARGDDFHVAVPEL